MDTEKLSQKYVLIASQSGAGGRHQGAENGPWALHKAGVIDELNRVDVSAEWLEIPQYHKLLSDDEFEERHQETLVNANLKKLEAQAIQELRSGKRVAIVGGDHSAGEAGISALHKAHNADGTKKLKVLWIDAHGDFNNRRISDTGNYHGMSLSKAAGKARSALNEEAVVDPENILVWGARDLDEEEEKLMRESGVNILSMKETNEMSMGSATKAVEEFTADADLLYVSLDIDALSPGFKLATGTPVPGGFEPEELLNALKVILGNPDLSNTIIVIELSEINPEIKDADALQTAELGRDALVAMLAP